MTTLAMLQAFCFVAFCMSCCVSGYIMIDLKRDRNLRKMTQKQMWSIWLFGCALLVCAWVAHIAYFTIKLT